MIYGRLEQFLTLPSQTLYIRLKSALLRALSRSKKIHLACRPRDVKFDESRAIFLSKINSCHGLSIGDLVNPLNQPHWLTEGTMLWQKNLWLPLPAEKKPRVECIITGFFELNGNITNGTGLRVQDIFCSLVKKEDLHMYLTEDLTLSEVAILRAGVSITDPVQLFWVEGLEKVYDQNLC